MKIAVETSFERPERFSFAFTADSSASVGLPDKYSYRIDCEGARVRMEGELPPLVDKLDTFRDHPDARRALALAVANLKVPAGISDGSLVKSSQGLHVLDNAPLVGNQQQLICKDAKGAACEKPPGAADTVRDCVVGAGGFAGLGCLATGGETVGIGCVVSAVAAVGGGLICAHDVSQRSSCTCVTPCAAQCQQTFNRQYACPSNNTTSCSNAAANDRIQEASCVRSCPAG